MKFEITSDLDQVQKATSKIRQFFGPIRLSKSDEFDLRLCFEEAVINAIKYGNQKNRELAVSIEVAFNDREVFVAVEDQGNGFDPNRLKDPTQDENIESSGGRGVYLLKHLMDRVTYSDKGNRVEMIKQFAKVG